MNHEFLMNHAKKQYIPGIRLKKKKACKSNSFKKKS